MDFVNNRYVSNETTKASVRITGQGNYYGTIRKEFVIVPAKLTIKADSATKSYDGTPLTKESCTVVDGTSLKGEDAIRSASYQGSITNNGVVDNIVSDAVIEDVLLTNVTDCYEITYQKGTLRIGNRQIGRAHV